MFTFDVRADFSATIAGLNRVKQGLGDQVLVTTLNETIAQSNTQMARNIAKTFNIKVNDVKAKLSIQRASRKGNHFEATLLGNPFGRAKRSLNLIRFLKTAATKAAFRRKGTIGTDVLRFEIIKGKTISIPGTFILNVPGNPVFKRTGVGRGAIAPAFAIGVPQMFNTHRVIDPVLAFIPGKFQEVFDRRARYFFEQAMR